VRRCTGPHGGARTLVILDEVHHGGDAPVVGEAVREGVRAGHPPAWRSRTPFRSDTSPIPFVQYEPDSTASAASRATTATVTGARCVDGVVGR